MYKRFLLVAACAALTACAGPSGGAHTRQDLESKGGKRLAAGELRPVLTGARVSGEAVRANAHLEWSLGSDGALNGTVASQHGSFTQTGTWNISDDGKLCYALVGSIPEVSSRGCQEWYRLGSDHYAVEGTRAVKRDVARR